MPEIINIKSDEFKRIAGGQAVVEARQQPERECRILSVSATAVTTPAEIFAGEIRYVGKVTFDCIVLADGAIECLTTVSEFSDKITAQEIKAGMNVTLVPEVINTEASVEGGIIKTVAVIDTAALCAVGEERACMAEPDDGIYADRREIEYMTVCSEQSETVYVTDSVSVSKMTDVLCAFPKAVITGAEAGDGEVKVTGAVYTNVVMRTEDDTVTSVKVVTPFVKSISALGAREGNTAFASAAVTDGTATLAAEENRLELSSTVTVNVTVLESKTANAVTDVFCSDNEIEQTTSAVVCQSVEPQITVADTVDGQIPIPDDKPAADNVLCVTGTFCTVSDAKIEDKRVVTEGLIGGDIVYYNAEKNVYDTLAFRLPFSMPLAVHTDAQNVYATAAVTDVSVRVRRESVFDIKAEVMFTLRLSSECECTFVESVKLGEPLARPDATVIVHIAKPGETLWQAAKALCCSPESVERQNEATAPYNGGERLINFCGK